MSDSLGFGGHNACGVQTLGGMRMNYTPNEPPLTLTAAEIEKILPHRYPFALVDKILTTPPANGRGASNA